MVCALGALCTIATEAFSSNRSSVHGEVFASEDDICPTIRVPLRKTFSKREALRQALWQEKDRLFVRELEQRLDVAQFELIVSFSFSIFPHVASALLARKYGIPWIADCRDITEQYGGYAFLPRLRSRPPLLHRPFYKLLKSHLVACRNGVLSQASAVTTVSPWHRATLQEALGKGKVPPSVYCIYNGYDEELFVPRHFPTERFRIVFTGRLLNLAMRDPSLLFDALSTPELQAIANEGLLEVHWYCDTHSHQLLQELLTKYGQEVRVLQYFHSMIPFNEVPATLSEASIILLLSNPETKDGPHGIVSTKIFEAMAMQKPILSIPGDGAISDELVKRAKCGEIGSTIERITQFISYLYQMRKKIGYTTTMDSDSHFVEQFTRHESAFSFARVVDKVL